MPYRAGFNRDSLAPETFTVGRSSAVTKAMIHGFQRRTDDGSDGLMLTTAASAWRAGFMRDVGAAGEPGMGDLSGVQETTVDFNTPVIPTANVAWRGGFLREISTGRIVWILAGVANVVATMQHGFMRTQRGDLILD